MGDPRTCARRPDRVPVADHALRRSRAAVPVRARGQGAGGGQARGGDPLRHPRRRAGASRPAVLVRRLHRAVRARRSGAAQAGADRPRRRHRGPRTHAGVRGAVRGRDRLPGEQPRRLREHGAPVPDVRRLLHVLRQPGARGAAARAVRLPARRREERGRRGALPPCRRRPRSRDGRGGRRHRTGRGARPRRGEGPRRGRPPGDSEPAAPGDALRSRERHARRELRLRRDAVAGAAGGPVGRPPRSAMGMPPPAIASSRTSSSWSPS
jgi:hypothetical protein